MEGVVLGLSHHLQVLNGVVGRVSVDVVDDLGRIEKEVAR